MVSDWLASSSSVRERAAARLTHQENKGRVKLQARMSARPKEQRARNGLLL